MEMFFEPVNLLQWNMFEKVKTIGHIEPFLATKAMSLGDIVFLHVGQQDKDYESGIYAYGVIVKEPYILQNSPQDYCNNKNTVDVRIEKIGYSKPCMSHDECAKYIHQFRTVHMIEQAFYENFEQIM